MRTKKVDLCVIQDGALACEFLNLKKAPAVKCVVVIDQTVPSNDPAVSDQHRALRAKASEFGIPLYFGTGMCAHLLCGGLAKKGQTVVACDRAAGGAGAIGTEVFCATPFTLKGVLETGSIACDKQEKTISIEGTLNDDTCAKNVALYVIKKGGIGEIKDKCVLLCDKSGSLSIRAKMVVCARLYAAGAASARFIDTCDSEDCAIDLADVKELVTCGGGYSDIKAIDELGSVPVNAVYIGGTAGGNLGDLRVCAETVRGKKLSYGVRLIASPATAEIYKAAANAGYITDIMESGGMVINHCASARIQARIDKDETMVSNDIDPNPLNAGFETSKVYLASTLTAAQSALSGRLGIKKAIEEAPSISLKFEGRVWKFGNDIDTDIIIPTQHLNYETMDEIKSHAFEPLRPELAAQLRDGDIIVAGSNFGCGSSREQAAEVIRENGVRCIIAKSFARIFFRNAINNGILLLECKDLPDCISEGDIVSVDLSTSTAKANGKVFTLPKIPENLYNIIMDGGLVRSIMKRVQNGEL